LASGALAAVPQLLLGKNAEAGLHNPVGLGWNSRVGCLLYRLGCARQGDFVPRLTASPTGNALLHEPVGKLPVLETKLRAVGRSVADLPGPGEPPHHLQERKV